MKNKSIAAALFILSAFSFIQADVAPDPGYHKERHNLTVETRENLSDYRFFLVFPYGVEEIYLNKTGPTEISAANRSGGAQTATVYAVPAKNLPQLPSNASRDQLESSKSDIENNKIVGTVKLFQHSFTSIESDGTSSEDAKFLIERTGSILTALDQTPPRKTTPADLIAQTAKKPFLLIGTILAGLFIFLAVLAAGIRLFRKKAARSSARLNVDKM